MVDQTPKRGTSHKHTNNINMKHRSVENFNIIHNLMCVGVSISILCILMTPYSGKSATIRESNYGSGVCREHYALRVVLCTCTKKLHFVSRNWRVEN